jgi:hypothetical protein
VAKGKYAKAHSRAHLSFGTYDSWEWILLDHIGLINKWTVFMLLHALLGLIYTP